MVARIERAPLDEAVLFKLEEHLAERLRTDTQLFAHIALAHLGLASKKGEDAPLPSERAERGRSGRLLDCSVPLLQAPLGADELFDYLAMQSVGSGVRGRLDGQGSSKIANELKVIAYKHNWFLIVYAFAPCIKSKLPKQ